MRQTGHDKQPDVDFDCDSLHDITASTCPERTRGLAAADSTALIDGSFRNSRNVGIPEVSSEEFQYWAILREGYLTVVV